MLGEGIRRILAPNPSPMTAEGTNSFILGEGRVAVIDPGPAIPAHLEAIRAALRPGERVEAILVTHPHCDHSGLARPLAAATGAPVFAFGDARAGISPEMAALALQGALGGGEGADEGFVPDVRLADGEWLEGPGWRVEALWTPGHMGSHLSFRMGEVVFTGDLVMGWASTLISPPEGDLAAYRRSLARLAEVGARRFLPGHGPAVEDPGARIAELLAHRAAREAAILAALGPRPQELGPITRAVYADTPPALLPAAARNALAHLIDLAARGLVVAEGPLGPAARFRRA